MKKIREKIIARLKTEDKKIIGDSFWNLFGTMGGQLIMSIVSLLNARVLGVVEYGKWGIILSTIGIFITFLSFGVSVTAMKHLAEYRDSNKEKASIIYSLSLLCSLVFGVILSTVMYFLSEVLAVNIFNSSDLEIILKITSSFLLLNAVSGVLSGSLSGLDGYQKLSHANLLSATIGGIPIIFLAKSHGILGIAIGYGAYYVMNIILYYIQLQKQLRIYQLKFVTKKLSSELPMLYKYSLPAMVSGSIGGPVVWVVSTLVVRMENGFAILGIFNAAKICQNLILNIGVKINNPLITLMSNFKTDRANLLGNCIPFVYISIVVVPLIVFPELFTVLFGQTNYSGTEFNTVVTITSVTGYIMVFKQIYGRQIITNNKLWLGVYENIIWSILLLSGILLIKNGNVILISLCYLGAYFIDLMIITPVYLKYKLISKKIIYTIPSFFMWGLLLITPIFTYFSIDIEFRVILYLSIILLSWKQYKIIIKTH